MTEPRFEPGSEAPESRPLEPQPGLSPTMRGCLLGAGIVITVLIILFLIGVWVLRNHSGDILAWSLERAKPEILTFLSPDHRLEQRKAFSQAYDQMVLELKRLGVEEFTVRHSQSFEFYQKMLLDRRITLEESQKWLEIWEEEMKKPSSQEK